MKQILLSLLSLVFLINCHAKEEQHSQCPLSQIKDFDVCIFLSPYEKYDCDVLFNTAVESLKTIGPVEIVRLSFEAKSEKTPTLLFLSLGGYQQENEGSIEIISPVAIEANQFKMNCSIWNIKHEDKSENSCYPVFEDGKIVFKRDPQVSTKKIDPEERPVLVLKQLIENFAEEYRNSNSNEEKPTFHIYKLQ